jgi:phosphoribosylcarboxyaminoimidazole (NCAIR) mutase
MHKATETLESFNLSTETGVVGIGRTEEEAVENYDQNKMSGANCFEHLAIA